MGDYLDKELSKSIDEIDVDKLKDYLNSISEVKEASLSKRENRAYLRLYKKRIFNKNAKKKSLIIVRRRILIAAVFLFALFIAEASISAVAEVSLISKIRSLLTGDEIIIIEEGYIDNNITNIDSENTLIDFSDLIEEDETFEYLLPFEDLVENIYCSDKESSKIYTVICNKENDEFHIRVTRIDDKSLAKLNYKNRIDDSYKRVVIYDMIYFCSDIEIIYYDNENCLYSFHDISIQEITDILGIK